MMAGVFKSDVSGSREFLRSNLFKDKFKEKMNEHGFDMEHGDNLFVMEETVRELTKRLGQGPELYHLCKTAKAAPRRAGSARKKIGKP